MPTLPRPPNPTAASPRARPLRVVRYHRRALTGDGGITNSVWSHSAELVGAGAEVVIAHDGGPPRAETHGIDCANVRHVGGGPWRIPIGLDDVLERADVLVLHSAWALPNVAAGTVARRLRVPYVLEPRGAYDPRIVGRKRLRKRAWWTLWERRLVRGATAIHVFFESEREHLQALGYRGHVIVAPNGVHVPDGVRWDGGSGGYVLWYGRFDPEHKGVDLLLHAVRRMSPDERPRLKLHGPDVRGGKDAMRRLVAELGLRDRVTIGAPVFGAEKYGLLSRATAFVYPSRWEGFGNAAAEAASIGVPTIVTPYPLGCFLAERGGAIRAEATPEALADGLRAAGASGAAEVGRRAAEIVRDEITWERVVASWMRQIREIL